MSCSELLPAAAPPRADASARTAPGTAPWRVLDYTADSAPAWNAFVRSARNATFLFERGYMDYHADRYEDASLMLWQGDELRAVLPASRTGAAVLSHGGLSFGGLILHASTGAQQTLELTEHLADALRARGVQRLVYKPVPHIFHRQPSEDDLYALHRLGARTLRMDVSTTIDLARRPALAKGRRHALSKARRAGIEVRTSDDYESMWAMLTARLAQRHDTAPTHSVEEIRHLASRFSQIRLIAAFAGEGSPEMLAGAVVYRYDGVLHTQYLCASEAGRELGALDAVIAHLIEHECDGCRWLNFGISTYDQGRQLNAGLAAQKEMFGGRSTVTQVLELELDRG